MTTSGLSLGVAELTVRYGSAAAVRGVSFKVEAGTLCAIVGPNGAGKSSMLAGILGCVPASQSALTLGDRSIASLSPTDRVKRGLVLVPQGHPIFRGLRVRDNLQVVADGMGLDARAIDVAFERFPILRERADAPARVLSGGEQQMLALARALICRPAVLLLDEPMEGLAPAIVSGILASIEDMRHDGATVVVAEPTTRVLPARVDQGLVMMRGEIVAQVASRSALESAFERQFAEAPAVPSGHPRHIQTTLNGLSSSSSPGQPNQLSQ
jgi:branched-chain amino acid transport system ATP-binding protein